MSIRMKCVFVAHLIYTNTFYRRTVNNKIELDIHYYRETSLSCSY